MTYDRFNCCLSHHPDAILLDGLHNRVGIFLLPLCVFAVTCPSLQWRRPSGSSGSLSNPFSIILRQFQDVSYHCYITQSVDCTNINRRSFPNDCLPDCPQYAGFICICGFNSLITYNKYTFIHHA